MGLKEITVLNGDFSDKIDNENKEYDVLLRDFTNYELNDLKNNEAITVDGKHARNPTLIIEDCNFGKLTIKNLDKVVIKDCDIKHGKYEEVLNIRRCEKVKIVNTNIKHKPADIDHKDHVSWNGIDITASGSIRMINSSLKGLTTAISCYSSDLSIERVVIVNSFSFLECYNSDIEIIKTKLVDNEKILSNDAEIDTCNMSIEESPDFNKLLLERL